MLPERTELAVAQANLEHLRETADAIEAQLAAVTAEQGRFEAEATVVTERIAQIDTHLYDGTVVAHKDLEAMQAEQEHLRERLVGIEDHVIEQMEAAEPLQDALDAAVVPVAEAVGAAAAAQRELDEAVAVVEAELAELEADRVRAAAGIDGALLATYESLRARHGGVGVARLEGARCMGCHLEIPAGELDQLRKAATDAVVLCPECNRILVR